MLAIGQLDPSTCLNSTSMMGTRLNSKRTKYIHKGRLTLLYSLGTERIAVLRISLDHCASSMAQLICTEHRSYSCPENIFSIYLLKRDYCAIKRILKTAYWDEIFDDKHVW